MAPRATILDWLATGASVSGVFASLFVHDLAQRVAIRFGPHAHQRMVSSQARWINRSATLERELAVQLYVREILPKAAARRLSGMERVAFDELLGQRGIPSRLTAQDLDEDLANLAAYRAAVGRGGPG